MLGVVFELFVVEKNLLARRKGKLGAAVSTLQYSILEFHGGRLPLTGTVYRSGQAASSPVPVPCLVLNALRARTARKISGCNRANNKYSNRSMMNNFARGRQDFC